MFVELGPPIEVEVVMVTHGDSTAVALATTDMTASNGYSWGSTSFADLVAVLSPVFCESTHDDEAIEQCDGNRTSWDEIADVLHGMPPTPGIDEMLRQIEVRNVVGVPDKVASSPTPSRWPRCSTPERGRRVAQDLAPACRSIRHA